MKSFTLINWFLIYTLRVNLFFANPTNLLAIVGWLFILIMLVSGVSSLMVYFKREWEPLLLPTASGNISIVLWGLFAINISMECSQSASATIIAWVASCLESLYTARLSSSSPTSIPASQTQPALSNALILSGIWALIFSAAFFSQPFLLGAW